MLYYKKLTNLAKIMPFVARTETMKSWFLDRSEQKSDFKLFRKTLRRIILLLFLRQWRLRQEKITPYVKRILWLHTANHIGDSLMRLSVATLLSNFEVDLCANTSVTNLFLSGKLFKQVFNFDQDEKLILKQQYDLIVLDDLKSGSIKRKKKLFSKIPFVTIHEFFDYCRDDFNFIFFSWHRMAYLLRDIKFYEDIESQAKLTIDIPAEVSQTINKLPIESNTIAVAVGGKEKDRTYQAWPVVIKGLLKHDPNRKIILLGSDNGLKIRDSIIDCVAQYSLLETAAIIKKCCMLICADGGLLHIANAAGTPSISLFAAVKPELRFTRNIISHALYTQNDVNHIDPDEIIKLAITG